ncbi:hypothetical protein DPMN_070580 [Dreissena polymorpha]|uniref:Uncharacterized protein n=1 Tax=Dreissena polymorpha TaxID=45954 RepID=A0A9D4BV74_DREPO|nr:hypothetical protein DPMN_070580 [Dreissena polymorpha]
MLFALAFTNGINKNVKGQLSLEASTCPRKMKAVVLYRSYFMSTTIRLGGKEASARFLDRNS